MGTGDADSLRPLFRPEREVRFAVVLYGGVSLAIYINGVVQELLRLVRATAPVYPYPQDPEGQRVYFPTSAAAGLPKPLRGSELVYRKLAQALPLRDPVPGGAEEVAGDADVRTRFVVDILSGSSAGGINGIFLAKALANQQDIDALRKLWVDEGDIGMLLNDKPSYESIPEGVERQKPPRSLLNGQRLYTLALNALREMRDPTERPADVTSPSYAEQIDLAVTTTDLQGLLVPIALHDRVVYEHRHRHVFHFVYATQEATGEERNDFDQANDGMLAFAARATSSFPFAFEPVLLEDTQQVDPALASSFGSWGQFFEEYVERGAEYSRYAFADGGYLDNKPFTHATAALRRRRSDVPVDRKLVYVEPDPSGVPTPLDDAPLPAEFPQPRPDVIANITAAAMGLPRSEPIRDDIQAVLDRNATIEQIRTLTLRVELDFLESRDPFEPLRRDDVRPNAPDTQLDELLGACAMFHHAYRNLRAVTVAEELASMIASITNVREESDTYRAISLVVRTWIDERHSEDVNAFLYRFDLGYRLRRLKFLQDRINDLLRGDERSARMLTLYRSVIAPTERISTGDELESQLARSREELLRLKLQLNDIFVELRRRGRAVRQRQSEAHEARGAAEVRAAVGALASDAGELHDILTDPSADPERRVQDRRDRARAFVHRHRERLDALEATLDSYFRETFERTERETVHALSFSLRYGFGPGGLDVRALIRGYYRRFDSFDAISLPLTHPDLGETNPVDIIRISPQDAPSIIDEVGSGGARTKLAGAALGHFGGFLDAKWRRNDILWGRLDAAERILASILPVGGLRDDLLLQAQAAIVREELLGEYLPGLTDLLAGALLRDDVPAGPFTAAAIASLSSGTPVEQTALVAALRSVPDAILVDHLRQTYQTPGGPESEQMLGVAGRAVDITGKVLEETSRRRALPKRPWFWASRIGRLAWGVGELAMPRPRRTVPAAMVRYWLQLAVLLAALLILFGVLGVQDAQKVGWILLGIVVGLRVLVWLAEALTASPEPPPPSATGPPAAEPAFAVKASRLVKWVELAALGVAAVGGVLVLVGIFASGVLELGWWLIAGGLLVALLAYLVRVGLASHRRLLALVLAATVIAVIGLAAVEAGRHGGDDVRAAAGILPGDRAHGFEHSVRDAVDAVWTHIWPWD